MADSKLPEECPLCGTKLRLPSFKCKSCNTYLPEDAVVTDSSGKSRCPECKLLVKNLSEEEIKKEYKCRECGFNIGEMENLEKETSTYILGPKEKLTALEKKLETLSVEIDKILEETKSDEIDLFTCPECKTRIEFDSKTCPGCGIDIIELEELPEVISPDGDSDKLECSQCGALLDSDAEKCNNCGITFVESEAELFVCPKCNGLLNSESESCPTCNANLVTNKEELSKVFDKEIEEAAVHSFVKDIPIEKPAHEKAEEVPLIRGLLESLTTPEPQEADQSIPPVKDQDVSSQSLSSKEPKYMEYTKASEYIEPQIPLSGQKGLSNGTITDHKRVQTGFTNGMTNGITNGLKALRMGITNGITDGNGITNGLRSKRTNARSGQNKLKIVIVPMLVLLLVLSPYILTSISKAPEGIKIDGKFGDWNGVTTAYDQNEAVPFNPNVDIIDYRVDDRQVELSFYLKVDGLMLIGEPGGKKLVDTAYIFIDKDQNHDSGYYVNGIGADYMIEIYGWGGQVIRSSLHIYNYIEQDWNLWEWVDYIDSAVKDSELETKMPYSALYMKIGDAVDVLFYMQSWDGFDDFSDTVISNEVGILQIEQQGIGEDVILGNDNRMLRLDIKAINSDISFIELSVKRTGLASDTDTSAVRLEDENGNAIAIGTISANRVTFRRSLVFPHGQSRTLFVVVDINPNANAENSIGFYIEHNHDVLIESGTVSIKRIKSEELHFENSYILSIPDNIIIDGAFADWNDKFILNDTDSDTARSNLDIIKYGVSNTETQAAFYLHVEDEICGGYVVPYWNKRTKPEPEIYEGEGGGIGQEIPPKTGEDLVYIFIDTDSDSGYKGYLPVRANYMIEIKGRYNKIISARYYEWTGRGVYDWMWTQRGSVDVGLDSQRMEVGIDWIDIGINPFSQYFEAFIWTTDWEKSAADYSDDSIFYSLNQAIMDNLLMSGRGTRGTFTSDHIHPNGAQNSEAENPNYLDLDEDANGDANYQPSGDVNDGTTDWIEVYFPDANIPGSAFINDITYYYGYYTNDGWLLEDDDSLANITWRVNSNQNDVGNYTLTNPPDPNDTDTTLVQTTNLPKASNLNSGNFIIRFRGNDNGGGPDRFYLDYCYFTINYSVPDIVINEIMSDPTGGIYDNDWSYRKKITINEDKVLGDLEDFPVLISITDSDLASDAQDDGDDILFTAIDGETKLDHEIESFNGSSGELVAWVKVPFVSSISDTLIYMYYGNSIVDDQSNPTGVWYTNYSAVWHMNESLDGTLDEFEDSTSNDYNGQGGGGTPANVPLRLSGKISGGQRFDGSNDYVDVSSFDPMDYLDFTISTWYKASNTTVSDDQYIFGHLQVGYGTGPGVVLQITDDSASVENEPQIRLYDNSDTLDSEEAGVNVTADLDWHYITFTRNSTRIQFVIDGVLTMDEYDDFAGQAINVDATGGGPFIGDWPGSTEQVDATLDELRISNVARSVAWISTEYNNQFNPSTFYSVGSEESTSSIGSGHEWVEIYNYGDSSIDLTGWYLTDNDGSIFDISGAGSIPVGGYLVCHIGLAGTNSSTDVYGTTYTTTIQPDATDGKDTYISDASTTTNYGTNTYLRIQNTSTDLRRSLLHFDLASLAQNDIMLDASVWLYRSGGGATSADTNVHRVTQNWTESGATWDTYDGSNDWPVNNDGGDYDTQIEDTTTVAAGVDTWYSWDITNLTKGWMNDTYQNNGMIFISDFDSDYHRFLSSDYTVDTSLRPKLVVDMEYSNMLGFADGLYLRNGNDGTVDYIAWGNNPENDDDNAVIAGIWTDNEFIDISSLSENESFGRDMDSTETNTTSDWIGPETNRADPFGIHGGSWTNGSRNLDQWVVINEILYDPVNSPYDVSWGAKKNITINASQISANLTDYPMYFKITDSDLASKARSDGDDILFVGPDGDTKLDHEIEYYNGATGELIAWIKIPYLSSISDTTIFMYYNNSGAQNQENVKEVWSNGYAGVYHMSQESGPITNSVSSVNYGGRVNEPTRTSGILGYGQDFTGGNTLDMFNLGDLGIADGINENITFSLWANIDLVSSDTWARILSKQDQEYTGFDVYDLCLDDVQNLYGHINDNGWPDTALADQTWYRFTLTYDGTDKNFYVNDTLAQNEAQSGALQYSSAPVTIGAREIPNAEIAGILDEVRISIIPRTAEWVDTEWNNQFNSNSFFFLDSEIPTSGTTGYEWVELYNPSGSTTTLNDLYLYDNDGNRFDIKGAITLASDSYLMCYLGQSGTNSSTRVYGPIITDDTSTSSILGMYDDVAIISSEGYVFDYVAWGSDPGFDDDIVVSLGNWTDGNYVNSSLFLEGQTLGRDMMSNDTDSVSDWENATNYADPFGVDRSTVNGSTPGAQNVDMIPEFSDIMMPFTFMLILFAVWRRRWIANKKNIISNEETRNRSMDQKIENH